MENEKWKSIGIFLPKAKKNIIKAFILTFLISNSSFLIFSQKALRTVDLSTEEPSWQAVVGGEAVSRCLDTSYGVALMSDGRLLSACTSAGNVIWQRSVRGKPTPYISSFGDFLYVVTDSSKLNLVNPSGLTLWTANTQFPVAASPIVGRDGRVFVHGKKNIACYGLDGKRKWKRETSELGNLPVCALEDGSLLLFLKAMKNNQSVATRYSPFGKRMEDITFSGVISSVESSEKGVLISLKNGAIGLVAVENDGAVSKWVVGSGNTGGAFKICYSSESENAVFFFQNGSRTEALVVDTRDGKILNRFQVGSIAPKDFKTARASSAGYFISGSHSACEFSEDGKILYVATLPPADKWNSISYTDKNYIVLCMKDWTMKAFLMNQNLKKKQKKDDGKPISYVSAVDFDPTAVNLGVRPLSNSKMAEISESFKKGDYGEKEAEYLELLKSEAENCISAYTTLPSNSAELGESNFFAENAVFTQNLLYLMSRTGTREFSLYYYRLLSAEIDDSQLLSIITFAGEAGYDEEGFVLLALEKLLLTRVKMTDTSMLKAICDATYNICRYMGRPALNRRGKNILTHMFFPSYDKNIQDYARKTLEKMISLEKK